MAVSEQHSPAADRCGHSWMSAFGKERSNAPKAAKCLPKLACIFCKGVVIAQIWSLLGKTGANAAGGCSWGPYVFPLAVFVPLASLHSTCQ